MAKIHPTAIIDSSANIADDVTIGPHCIIEGQVNIASGNQLVAHVHLRGPLTLGENNCLYPYVCLGFAAQDIKFSPDDKTNGVVIGSGNVLRESVTIHGATGDKPTTLGNHNYFMVNSHLGHDVLVGNNCMFANGSGLGGHVHAGDNTVFGGGAVVQQFCHVGRLAMISGVVGITRDLPPFCMVYNMRHVSSLNLVGLRRAGLSKSIPALRKAFNILYRQERTNSHAVQMIESELADEPLCQELARFVKESKRGICAYEAKSHAK